jgi:ABC-2 type transport system ATP-binding protein
MTSLAHPPPSGDFAIDLRHVAKTYRGKIQALRGINMQVRRGGVFGLLGPNGAGKSTLVKIMMTVIRASRCEGHMLGQPVGHKPTLARVGYLPEHHRFPDYLTGAQILDFYGSLANVERADRKKRIPELLELVGMSAWANKKVKSYSKGMRQRVGIAQALVNDPDLVVLDEPTDGVDPVGRRDIRNVLLHLRERGKTVFLNSHLLSELEMVCDHVAILVQGMVSSQGTIEELTRSSRRYEIEIAPPVLDSHSAESHSLSAMLSSVTALMAAPTGAPPVRGGVGNGDPANAVVATGTLRGSIPVTVYRSSLTVGSDDPAEIQPIIDALRGRGVAIKAVRPLRASLEDLFMLAVTDPTTGQALAPGAGGAARGKKRRGGGTP